MSEEKLSLLRTCAQQYQMEPAAFAETVRKTVFPGGNATNEQLAAFLAVAQQYGLNPFTKQIFAFPSKGGGVVPMVSLDGWAAIINARPELDGIEFADHLSAEGALTAVTCRIYRKDRSHPTEVTEHLAECSRDTEPWKKWPARMLRHKALIQCARYSFALSGIYDPDEGESIQESEAARERPAIPQITRRSEAALRPSSSPPPPTAGEIFDALPDSDPDAPISRPQIVRLFTLVKRAGKTEADLKTMLRGEYGIDSTSAIRRADYDDICAHFGGGE